MPNVSRAQQGFFALSKTSEGRNKLLASGKKPVPVKVVNEFFKADKGLYNLPRRVHNGKAVR